MPQILVLDRHPVTTEERIKADKLAQQDHPAKVKHQKNQIKKHSYKGGMNSFSAGEKDLYRDVAKLNALKK